MFHNRQQVITGYHGLSLAGLEGLQGSIGGGWHPAAAAGQPVVIAVGCGYGVGITEDWDGSGNGGHGSFGGVAIIESRSGSVALAEETCCSSMIPIPLRASSHAVDAVFDRGLWGKSSRRLLP